MENIIKLNKDLKTAATIMTDDEARYLVDAYYQMQDNRIIADNQVRATQKTGEPNAVIGWLADQNGTLETQIKNALDKYSAAHPVGQWMRSIKGIGPVIAAGLLAHINITKAPTAGHIWAFAGLDPTKTWNKGENRPHNAKLKTLCWKIGQSFVKVSGDDEAFYGQIYKERKAYEQAKNEAGDYAAQAAAILEKKKIGKSTDAYKAYSVGKLPPAHIQARVCRYSVKIFLSHLHHVWYVHHYGTNPPRPFAIEHLGHAHMIAVPNFEAA